MARKCSRSRSPMPIEQLQPIPELEPLDDDCSGNQAEASTDVCLAPEDWLSLWSHAELKKTLHTLMMLKYAGPFTVAQSSSLISLQEVVQRVQDDKYENKLDMFWSDVEACWDCSERTFASPKRLYMAKKMRACAEQLELDFWSRWSELKQCPPMTGKEARLGALVMDSWVMDQAADFGEWLFFGVATEA